MSAGPLLFFDRRTCQPTNLRYKATMYSASLPNVPIEYDFILKINMILRLALSVAVKTV